jgi:hypothetical protein
VLIVLLLEIFLVNIMIDFVERIWEGKKVFFCVNEIKCVCVLSPGWWEYGEIIFVSYEIWLSR